MTQQLNPMATAPRDGTIVRIADRSYGVTEMRRARACSWWVTDEFIPVDILDGDTQGANHGAIPEEAAAGWLPDDSPEAP